jgi:hypothetical protein
MVKAKTAKGDGTIPSPVKLNARGEVLQIRSPAEFFAENQVDLHLSDIPLTKQFVEHCGLR